jgi:hypothetical protein
VEADCHNPIGGIKGLLDPISMMTINIDVEYAGVRSKKFENGENDVVDVAESGGLPFLRVMETTSPVDRYFIRP